MPKRVGVKTAYDFVAGVIPYQSLIFNLPSFLFTMIIQFCPKDDSSSRLLLLPLCIDLGLQRTDHSRPPLISVLNYCSFFFLIFLFLSSFFLIYPYELTSAFHPPHRGKTYFSAFLVQICYVCQCRALLIIYSPPPYHLYAHSSSSGAPLPLPHKERLSCIPAASWTRIKTSVSVHPFQLQPLQLKKFH